jgi:hypothetical protein
MFHYYYYYGLIIIHDKTIVLIGTLSLTWDNSATTRWNEFSHEIKRDEDGLNK